MKNISLILVLFSTVGIALYLFVLKDYFFKVEDLYAKENTGLKHNIPSSKFKPFNFDDIEEGRLYFWVNENKEDLLKSEAVFFTLQDREKGLYVLSEKKPLEQFNQTYKDSYISEEDFYETIRNHIKSVKEQKLTEVSQERVLATLTQTDQSVTSQKLQNTMYLYYDDAVIDIYEKMIQEWDLNFKTTITGDETDEIEDISYRSYFFKTSLERDRWLKKQVTEYRNDYSDYEQFELKSERLKNFLDFELARQERNKQYLKQKPIKEKIFSKHPDFRDSLSDYQFFKLMKYRPLRVIEGDYKVDGNWVLDIEKESLIVTGDVIVDGTIYLQAKDKFGSSNNAVFLGNVTAKNYIQSGFSYSMLIFGKDLNISNYTLFPGALSNAWFLTILGKLNTDTYIYSGKGKASNKHLNYKNAYSTDINKDKFQSWFIEGKRPKEGKELFDALIQGKEIIKQ